MARQARVILADTPHHVSQRGNRGEPVFFEKADFETYRALMAEQCRERGIDILAYCLLPNQIHLIAVPTKSDDLARAIGEAHRRYTCYINDKKNWRGHLFQDRFYSCALDEGAVTDAAHFIETLPVTARIAPKPEQYLWSSAKAHLRGRDDPLLATHKPLLELVHDWQGFLAMPLPRQVMDSITLHLQTGRPRGGNVFLDMIEEQLGRRVRAMPVGRPKKAA